MIKQANPTMGTIPGPRGLPIVGNLPRFLPNPLPYIQQLHATHGNVFFANFAFGKRSVFLLGPEVTERILSNREGLVSNESGYAVQSRFLGERAILFQDGKAHTNLRQGMSEAFKPSALEGYLTIMNQCAHQQVSTWAAGGSGNIGDDIKHLALDIAS